MSVEDIEAWPERIGAVTAEAVNAAARAVLAGDAVHDDLLLPKDRTERETADDEIRRRTCPPSPILSVVAVIAPRPAAAVTVERVESPGGIVAWLVRDSMVPLVSIEFSFRGGAALDPAGKTGLADMTTSLLDEGAGDMDSQAFQRKLSDLAVSIGFAPGWTPSAAASRP